MNRQHYDRYLECFNSKNYDGVVDFYAEPIDMEFFGIKLDSRQAMKDFYAFLHSRTIETVRVLNFASSDTLTAVDGIVRVECTQDLAAEELTSRGMHQFAPMKKGDVIEMRQFIFYTIKDGKIAKVECALAA